MTQQAISEILQHAGTPTRLFAGNEWIEASGGSLPSINPATEEEICQVGVASADDVETVVAAAKQGAAAWRDTPWNERMAKINRLADAIAANAERLATVDTIESGLPITGMRGDAAGSARELRYFAGISGEAKGETYPDAKGLFASTILDSIDTCGVCVSRISTIFFAFSRFSRISLMMSVLVRRSTVTAPRWLITPPLENPAVDPRLPEVRMRATSLALA